MPLPNLCPVLLSSGSLDPMMLAHASFASKHQHWTCYSPTRHSLPIQCSFFCHFYLVHRLIRLCFHVVCIAVSSTTLTYRFRRDMAPSSSDMWFRHYMHSWRLGLALSYFTGALTSQHESATAFLFHSRLADHEEIICVQRAFTRVHARPSHPQQLSASSILHSSIKSTRWAQNRDQA